MTEIIYENDSSASTFSGHNSNNNNNINSIIINSNDVYANQPLPTLASIPASSTAHNNQPHHITNNNHITASGTNLMPTDMRILEDEEEDDENHPDINHNNQNPLDDGTDATGATSHHLMLNQMNHHQQQPVIPQLVHWSEVVYECTDVEIEDWSLAGGSDYGQLPYIIDSGDILLEINGQKVSGLTRHDVLQMLQEKPRHTIKAVSSSSSFGLPIDLREYLSRRFVRGSVDHDLQGTIRDNVYMRTIPCTTRGPRNGEMDGIDYKFVTKDEFLLMERSGVLLESGVYAGHYYGTPLPLSDPTGDGHMDATGISANNANGVSHSSYSDQRVTGAIARVTSNDANNGDDETSSKKQPQTPGQISLANKRKRNRSNIAAIDASSLPHGWEKISDATYGVYYIDHINKRTQYERPYEIELTKGSSGFGFTLIELDRGLVVVKNLIPGGPAYFSGVIQPGDVLVSVSGVSVSGLQHSDIAQLFSTFTVGDRVKLTFARGYQLPPDIMSTINNTNNSTINNNCSHQMVIPPDDNDFDYFSFNLEKGSNGFGFTITDGSSGQKVKKILDPERCVDLKQGDLLLSVNSTNLQSLNHNQVVEVLKECPVGDSASITIKRRKRFRSKTPVMLHSSDPYMESGHESTSGQEGLQRNCKTPSDMMMRRRGQMDGNNSIGNETPWAQQHSMAQLESQVISGDTSQLETPLHLNGGNNNQHVPTTPHALMGYADHVDHLNQQMMALSTNHSSATQIPPHALYSNQPPSYAPSKSAPQLIRHDTTKPVINYPINHHNQIMCSQQQQQETLQSTGVVSGETSQVSPDEEYEYFRVELSKGQQGFGFRIIGGSEEGRPVAIGSIVIGGVAHEDGILKSGDEIISINERNVMGSSHQNVVELMKLCTHFVSLLVRRKKDSDSFEVTLYREEKEGFGFVIISCGLMCLIGRIIDNSPAQRSMRLRVRDRISAVNGKDLTGISHPQIVNMIKESGHSLRLKIIPTDCYSVELVRGTRGFGFSIRGGAEFNGMPLFILRIAPDGPAYSLLTIGDEIIEINSVATVGMTHTDAVQLISQSGPQVRLKLRKNNQPFNNSSSTTPVAPLTPTSPNNNNNPLYGSIMMMQQQQPNHHSNPNGHPHID